MHTAVHSCRSTSHCCAANRCCSFTDCKFSRLLPRSAHLPPPCAGKSSAAHPQQQPLAASAPLLTGAAGAGCAATHCCCRLLRHGHAAQLAAVNSAVAAVAASSPWLRQQSAVPSARCVPAPAISNAMPVMLSGCVAASMTAYKSCLNTGHQPLPWQCTHTAFATTSVGSEPA